MRLGNTTWICAVVLGVVCSAAAALSSRVQDAFGYEDVPYVLVSRLGAGTLRFGCQQGVLQTSAAEKKVQILWTASAVANLQPDWTARWSSQHNAMGNHKAQGGTQEFGTRYYPTASCVLTAESVLIAGITDSGRTILEVWRLAWPVTMPAPVVDAQTGITSVAVALPSRTSVQRVFDKKKEGLTYVRNLCVLRRQGAQPTEALVQFHDSNDLHVLNLANGQTTLLASATSSLGALGQVVGLEPKNHSAIGFGDHTTAGYVYALRRGWKISHSPTTSSTQPATVVLVDSNRDGTIDAALQMTDLEYVQQGWADLDNYTAWWLD